MQITPVAQESVTAMAATVAPQQAPAPVQAPVQQQPQTRQKDDVILSQAAKDLASQVSGMTVQEQVKKTPAVETSGGLTQAIR